MRAVKDDYQSRTMPVLCEEALAILCDVESGKWLRCSYIGEQLFRDAYFRGSCPFARIAGKVLKRLEAIGLARSHGEVVGGQYRFGWAATSRGRRKHDKTIWKRYHQSRLGGDDA